MFYLHINIIIRYYFITIFLSKYYYALNYYNLYKKNYSHSGVEPKSHQ